MKGVLAGVKVIDLGQFMSAPVATALLGDFGAEIIKVENPEGGDGTRPVFPFIHNQSYIFIQLNRNKKSITLNLKSKQGKEIFKKLVKKADVVINNFVPGVMERLGLAYEELEKVNPQIIYASITGYGQTGPYRSLRCYDSVAQAAAGVMSLTGYPDGPPTKAGPSIADFLSGTFAALGILGALCYRKESGEGQEVDISMFDIMCGLSVEFWGDCIAGTRLPPRRLGNRDPNVVPANCFSAKDGYVIIYAGFDREWVRLTKLMGREELGEDPRFSTVEQRVHNRDEVESIVQEWTAGKTVDELVNQLEEAKVVCGPVLELEQMFNHPQVLARGLAPEIDHPIAGKVKVPGPMLKLSKSPTEIRLPAPLLGQHNEEIYSSLLGYSKQKIEKLKREGVI